MRSIRYALGPHRGRTSRSALAASLSTRVGLTLSALSVVVALALVPTVQGDETGGSAVGDGAGLDGKSLSIEALEKATEEARVSPKTRLTERAKRKEDAEKFGATKKTERAVAAAIDWLARHQNPDGSWSLQKFGLNCKGGRCDESASHNADAAATALAVLPFLAAGQSHQVDGKYKATVNKAIGWLVSKQKPNGDSSSGAAGNEHMYTHALAVLALCECYGISQDKDLKPYAQKGIDYLELAQDRTGGGWRYEPNEPGDTSVTGWCLAALYSGEAAGLKVKRKTFGLANAYLSTAGGKGKAGGLFGYMPGNGPTPAMTSIGTLYTQYDGLKFGDAKLTEANAFLEANSPDKGQRNAYYAFYAAQVIHNLQLDSGRAWTAKLQEVLLSEQVTEGCARGSWSPAKPKKDQWGEAGGRIFMTSLNCLILQTPYRHPPLYAPRLDGEKKGKETDKEKDAEKKKPKPVDSDPFGPARQD